MSINENDIIDGILAHMVTLGYTTSADDNSPSDFLQRAKPFAFVTNVVTPREPVNDAQTTDDTRFILNLWEEAGQRVKLISDIQALIALLEADTTLGGTCDLCQVLDATQVIGEDVEGQKSYWTVDISAVFVS